MIERASEDRRIKKVQVDENNRKNLRRDEDIKNLTSYYITVFILISILSFIITISLIWG